jgi:hypothetical protein
VLTAYVDESLRRRADDLSVYAMAAVVVDSADHEALRATLKSLLLGNRRRLHWRDESPKHRIEIAEALASLPIEGMVVAHIHDRTTRHERARRLCLERLLHELGAGSAAGVVIESRSAEDRLDRGLLTGLRRSRRVPLSMEVRWESPLDEPLLWSADAVVGATTWWLDGQPEYFDIIADQVTVICVE